MQRPWPLAKAKAKAFILVWESLTLTGITVLISQFASSDPATPAVPPWIRGADVKNIPGVDLRSISLISTLV
jgi:hypothetical protein